jgi:large subunit ribosomal protein L6
MSRVGKAPIPIPENIKIKYKDRIITVESKKGVLTRVIHPAVDLKIEDGIWLPE